MIEVAVTELVQYRQLCTTHSHCIWAKGTVLMVSTLLKRDLVFSTVGVLTWYRSTYYLAIRSFGLWVSLIGM